MSNVTVRVCGTSAALGEKSDGLVAPCAMALAAIVHQKSDQIRKRREFGALDDGFPVTPVFDQACAFQLFEVEGNERWAGIAQGCGNGPGRHAFRTCKDQQPDDPQADLLRQGRKSGQGSFFFHINQTL
ncbi:hypothetical protein [Paracoccus marcusii]